jgi:hypothetical protein
LREYLDRPNEGIGSAVATADMVGPGAKKERGRPATIVPGLRVAGDTIAGRYRIEELLGAGSSGFVVAARQITLQKRVTLKLLTSMSTTDEGTQRRLLASAHRAAALRGRNVARIVDTGFLEDGTPFVATERLAGRTLAEELAERRQVPARTALAWTLHACAALAEAHAAGIVHGDLKPQNLFLAEGAKTPDEAGEPRVLKVLDFGMAAATDPNDAGAAWFASPAYLAPERLRGSGAIDARADVWALGVLLHEMIAGGLPFDAESVSGMLVAVAHDEPSLLAAQDTPFALARIVKACLSKDPAGRPADVATLARQLAPFAGDDGPALLGAVEEAAASRPPPAAEDAGPAAQARGEPSSPPRGQAGVALRDAVRRRRGAIAAVAAAAALVLVGLLSSPGKMPRGAATVEPARPTPAEAPARPSVAPNAEGVTNEELAPPAKTPPRAAAPVVKEPPKPAHVPPPKPRAASSATWRRGAPASVNHPSARLLPWDESRATRPAGLSVRENPYGRRVAPARLGDRSK